MTLPRAFYDVPLAHRGLHNVSDGRPENSRAAIGAAIKAGYGVEIDVQLSADGVAMVFHDYALDRLTAERGALRQRSATALAEVTLTGNDEGIPDLAAALLQVDGAVPLLVELKDQDGAMGPNVGELEAAVADALRPYQGDVAVMSFNPHSVAQMATLLPDVPRGLVTSAYRVEEWPLDAATCDRLRGIPDYARVGASFISHEWDDLDRAEVAALKAEGAMICCWTVKSAADEAQARKIADNITFEGYLTARPA
jgi:glycerophosphoryl diester phosphodiesterase